VVVVHTGEVINLKEDNLFPEALLDKRYTPKYDPVVVTAQIEAYVQDTDYPIVKELCGKIGMSYISLSRLRNRYEEVEDAVQKLLNKAECYIERGALHKRLDSSFGQFRLKQKCFGWDDKHQIETSTADNIDINTVTKKDLESRLKQLMLAVKEAGD
jgi:hypothetical protein